MDKLSHLLQSRINTRLPIANKLLLLQAGTTTECKLCREEVPFKLLLTHFENFHIDFDHTKQCLVCLESVSFCDYERHVYQCIGGQEDIPPSNHVQRLAGREDIPPSSHVQRAGQDIPSSNHVQEAVTVLSAFEPDVWYHLILSRAALHQLASFKEAPDDFYVTNFRCWCKSANMFEDEELPLGVSELDHVHLLVKIVAMDNWQQLWSRLVNGYKKMLPIDDLIDFVHLLVAVSQNGICGGRLAITGNGRLAITGDMHRHYNVYRPIHPEHEYLIKIYFSESLYYEIERIMRQVSPAYFDIERKFDFHGNIVYCSLVSQILDKLDFGSLPVFHKASLRMVSDRVSETDRIVMYVSNGSVIVLDPGDSSLSVRDVLLFAHPLAVLNWTDGMHNVIHDIFQYVGRERR